MNKRWLLTRSLGLIILVLLVGRSSGQESGYLTQKLMVENDLRKRIAEALSKIIDESRYIIDVSVTLELSEAVEEQVTVAPAQPSATRGAVAEAAGELEQAAREMEQARRTRRETMVGLPIPGFEFEVEEGAPTAEEAPRPAPAEEPPATAIETAPAGERILSKVSSIKRPSVARIRKQEISIILQEGVAPELIENIRQVAMVASRFNRARGDVLSIMTASFKERRDEKTAEQVLLKAIADKIETLERQRTREQATQEDWQKELERYKEEEAKRREEDRLFFQSELAKLEMEAKARAFQRERAEILRRDSLKLLALNEEIQNLKAMLASAALPDTAAREAETAIQEKERQKAELDAQISEKIAMLEAVQSDLDRLQAEVNGKSTTSVVFLSLLGALLFILLIVVIFLLLNRTRPQYAAPPPPWVYPPRRPKKKKKKSKEPVTPAAPAPTPAPAAAAPPPPAVEEDPAVLQSEIDDIKKAVVSMSVGQPTTATRIVKEWMQEEAPPPPAPETPPPAPEPEAEEEEGKKKKKKKKK
jgi:flagellar biosynthesis/type III secretory pathway M-ring protein FliF/YscJ